MISRKTITIRYSSSWSYGRLNYAENMEQEFQIFTIRRSRKQNLKILIFRRMVPTCVRPHKSYSRSCSRCQTSHRHHTRPKQCQHEVNCHIEDPRNNPVLSHSMLTERQFVGLKSAKFSFISFPRLPRLCCPPKYSTNSSFAFHILYCLFHLIILLC